MWRSGWYSSEGTASIKLLQGEDSIQMDFNDIDANFISAMNLKLLAGSVPSSIASTGGEKYAIINETAMKTLKIKSSGEAIGKKVFLDDSLRMEVTGVVKDFNFKN